MRVIYLHARENYPLILGELPRSAIPEGRPRKNASFIHYIAKEQRALLNDFPKLKRLLLPDGGALDFVAQGCAQSPD